MTYDFHRFSPILAIFKDSIPSWPSLNPPSRLQDCALHGLRFFSEVDLINETIQPCLVHNACKLLLCLLVQVAQVIQSPVLESETQSVAVPSIQPRTFKTFNRSKDAVCDYREARYRAEGVSEQRIKEYKNLISGRLHQKGELRSVVSGSIGNILGLRSV